MMQPNEQVLSGETYSEFLASWNKVVPNLPADLNRRIREIQRHYLAFGFEGVLARMANRSIAQIISEFSEAESRPHPTASGEIDGVTYILYDRPSGDDRAEEKT